MKTLTKQSFKNVFLLFTLLFISGLITVNKLYAQGPNAPEAASFEPVDATDMVNLVTGDLSYVLPLLNVPSPEGGYPIALSYHAGIAMDLEASWVGLGWGLNPGAINRNVNGFPDDWGESTVTHFFNDAGWTDTYYDFGIGANIYGINVGVGAYWGSNKTFGGSVTFGIGLVAGTLEAGTRGLGVGGQIGPFSANVSTNGIGIGVGLNNSSYAGGGISLNYNYNSGLSSYASISAGYSSVGISFNSQGNLTGSIGSYGGGVNSFSSSSSAGDYAVTVTSKGVDLDLGLFRIKAGRTQVKYDLFKEDLDFVSGITHPFDGQNPDKLMDVINTLGYNEAISPIILVNAKDQLSFNHLLYAGFDNYTLTAQGLSGSIQPKLIEEMNLFSKRIYGNDDNYKTFNKEIPSSQQNLDLNNRLYFYFKNHYSSFLRTNTSSITTLGSNIEDAYNNSYTNESNIYTSTTTPNGELLVRNGRKREGNFIETFTNNDVNVINSQDRTADYFIEAQGIDRLNDKAFVNNGIGAFKVTAIDGKTYHYSLPVYNFELYYKNFNNRANEDEKFYLNTKDEPYATHWLLTAITGPDYLDTNRDGKLDKGDYGYWVEFEYGKWTDGYIWKGASGDYDSVKGDGFNDDSYEYYRGRKQIYYLDAIRTRTHTAYFVKSLREDSKGEQWLDSKNNSKITEANLISTNFNIFDYTKDFNSNKRTFISNSEYENLPSQIENAYNTGQIGQVILNEGFRSNYKYADFPKHDLLKLDKIILVNNDFNLDKSVGNELNNTNTAYFYSNGRVKIDFTVYRTAGDRTCTPGNSNNSCIDPWALHDDLFYRHNNFYPEFIDIHQSQNILDINDLAGLNIEQNAVKVIKFNYDASYPLVKNSPRSEATSKGKLTLNSISYGGKEGIQLTPPYRFTYKLPYTNFDVAKEDAWGYHKDSPSAWSLSEVKTPIGTKIKIDYESDDFYREAIDSKRILNNGLSFLITKNTSNELLFEITLNDHANAKTIEVFNNFTDYFQLNEYANLDLFICRRSKYGGHDREVNLDIDKVNAQVVSVTSQSATIKIPDQASFWFFDDQDRDWILNRTWSLTDVTFANGNSDGVIMKRPGLDQCEPWKASYSNDHVNINFQIATTKVPFNRKEGGLRVKTLEITDNLQSFKTNYFYNEKGYDKSQSNSNYRSSGITSYSPSKEAKAIPYVAELPSPMVMYKYVTVENIDNLNNIIKTSEYHFETLTPHTSDNNYIYSLGEAFKVKKEFETTQFNGDLIANKHTIYNKLNNLGRLISLKEVNSKGQMIKYQENNYKNNLDAHGEIGVFEESYLSKSHNFSGVYNGPKYYSITLTSRVTYPSVLESTTITQSGFSNTNYFNKYDFLTGQVLETITENSKGKEFKTELLPAYKIPEYSDNITYYGMGSKTDNYSHKNMLSQEAMTKTYMKVGGNWKETGVGITTWNNRWTYTEYDGTNYTPIGEAWNNDEIELIWRKHKSYVWNGDLDTDGTYLNYGTNSSFDWTVGQNIVQTNAKWKNTSTTTQYDHYSMPLEVKDINDNYAATKMCDNNSKVLVVSNAKYTEMFYSGAEYVTANSSYFDGHIKSAGRNSAKAHTGLYSVSITSGGKGFEVNMISGEHRAGKYKISVWVEKANHTSARINIKGVTKVFNGEEVFAGNWVLKIHYEDLGSGTETIYVTSSGSPVYFDDFRLHPIASSMASYVYNEWDELWYIIGDNGLASKFEYDAAGRLKKNYTEVADFNGPGTGGFKPVRVNNYNYKKPL